ncbi:MAG TPA: carboxyl transferase domain-containing protein, partial [Actinomycetota bacterium]
SGLRVAAPAGTFAADFGPNGRSAIRVRGAEFTVDRDDRGIVRAPAPAVVVAVPAETGQAVEAGDPLVVLEAMKMEMSVAAPHGGVIRRVLVGPNEQVGTGDPLLQLVPGEAEDEPAGEPATFDLLLAETPAAEGEPHARCRRTLEELRRLALGFDVDPSLAGSLGARWSAACAGAVDSEPILRGEREVLEILADVCSLAYRSLVPDEDGGEAMRAHEEELLTYLRSVDATQEALSATFVDSLGRAVAHHGVTTLDRTPELDDALYRLYRSHRRMQRQVPAVLAILDRRLEWTSRLRPVTGEEFRALLDRLAAATRGRYPAVSDLAREVRYRYFDQPLLEDVRRRVYAEVEASLSYLERNPEAPDREARVRWLVDCPQPLKRMLTERIPSAKPEARARMMEALVRRYYRIRELTGVRSVVVDGRPVVTGSYPHDGTTVHLVATHGGGTKLAEAAGAAALMIPEIPSGEDVVVDLYLWREGPPDQDPDGTAREIAAVLDAAPFGRPIRRIVVALSGPADRLDTVAMELFTFRPSPEGYREERLYRGLHPMMGKRLDLWRLSNFWIGRLPSVEDVYLFHGMARENPKDERLFALAEVRDMTPVRDAEGRVVALPHLELMITEALEAIRLYQSHRPPGKRLQWNRVLLNVWPPVDLPVLELFGIVHGLAPLAEGLGLEKVVVRARVRDQKTGELHDRVIHISNPSGRGLALRFGEPADRPIRPLTEYMQKVVQTRQKGLTYPYEIVEMLTPPRGTPADFPPGEFVELDLDEPGRLAPVDRPYGQNTANVVVGVITNFTDAYPEGMTRVAVLGDPSRSLGSLAEPECSRICAALDLAERMRVPLEWFAVSAGAKIAMGSGTENMDWIGRVLRRLIEFTQGGGEVNVLVCGINVGAQPYWNAGATMLMHTRGILVMTPDGAMVLTGKQALDYSGGVSAEDNVGIGGYDRVMGPNGQAQYWARGLDEACRILLQHYDHTYVLPGERFPRRVPTADPADRDVCASPHRPDADTGFRTVGDVFSETTNPGRKKPFDIRSVMRAAIDQDRPPLERWGGMRDAEIAVVWDAHLRGIPVCLLGIESRPLPRHEVAPADGPDHWTSGTLFPQSSKKIARAVNAASGNRPLVVLANLSGFDGSPESLRKLQLEYGAEIGRAVVNFKGPMVFCVISRYHGGAFVVFSRTLNESMEIAAVEGSFASVIGGAPAAAVVFAREVDQRTKADPRVAALELALAEAEAGEKA